MRSLTAPVAATTSSINNSRDNPGMKRTKVEHHKWTGWSSGLAKTISPDRDRHLAEMRATGHVSERGLRVGEWKHLVHHRLHAAHGDRVRHRLQVLHGADGGALQPLLLHHHQRQAGL